jgi:adenine deaminase
VADPERDLVKLVVLERHRGSGRTAVGFVRGLGLLSGALGTSVAHDAHNYIVAGTDDDSILTTLKELIRLGGGLVLAEGNRVLETLPLPVGGLMTETPVAETAEALARLEAAAAGLGLVGPHPCMALSFLSLSVIPALKLTDRGYVDICGEGLLKLFAD